MKRILLLVSIFLILTTNVYASPSKKECQDALVNSAYAYYYRGKALQYDSKPLTFQKGTFIQQRSGGAYKDQISSYVFYSPEEVTMQDVHFTVCSSYTNLILYETFKNSKNEGFVLRGNDNSFLRATQQIITIGESSNHNDIIAYYNDKIGDYKTNKLTDKLKAVYKKIQELVVMLSSMQVMILL